jgi:hypothetical protein
MVEAGEILKRYLSVNTGFIFHSPVFSLARKYGWTWKGVIPEYGC